VRVIIASGFGSGVDSGRIFMDGAEGYVHKPFRKRELMMVINSVIKN